jgi:hypothetical protein
LVLFWIRCRQLVISHMGLVEEYLKIFYETCCMYSDMAEVPTLRLCL